MWLGVDVAASHNCGFVATSLTDGSSGSVL